jgi:catecholate siderophore receptor
MLVVLSAVAASAAAQTTALRGRVVDRDGAAIAAAHVEVTADDRAAAPPAAADTSRTGEFSLALPPGRYHVLVTAPGFAALSQAVSLPQPAPVAFQLAVAAIREQVTVTARADDGGVASGTRTPTPLVDVPQSVTVIPAAVIRNQLMQSVADVVRYVPGIIAHQGENNRDQVIIRGNSSSADFFRNGVRDDVQYYRDLYNLERVEALKGPNAMIFGRGGGGGVINRVTKDAGFAPLRELTVVGGSFNHKRTALDFNQPLSGEFAVRLNTMYENSDSFRQGVGLERYGVNPTVTFMPDARTRVTAGYEYFNDHRNADRGITSFDGRPVDVDRGTYFGNAENTFVKARTNLASASIEHDRGAVSIRNRTLIGDYDRGYQNYVPREVTSDGSQATLTAYNNHTSRLNTFNQTDVTWSTATGPIRHLLLAGTEFGRQLTDNFRNTGYFNDTATSTLVPLANPTTRVPVVFRQSATDANNHVTTNVAAAYVQDQVDLSARVQAIGGVRFDRFDIQYRNNRNGDTLERVDHLVSPRAGLVYKPRPDMSIYSSYTVSFLPSSGDQFSSLTSITQQVKPERFDNYEVGSKWDVRSRLSLTAAAYRLDRTNTRATDPNDPTRIVQTGSQRTNGIELGANGQLTTAWQVVGGYAWQNAFVTSATTSARAGARVAQVPRHTFSLWNLYQVTPRIGGGLGIVYRSDMFAAIDNTVTLPGYTDIDAAVYVGLAKGMRLQVNVSNLLDRYYFVNADNNTNLSPGGPRSARVALVSRF